MTPEQIQTWHQQARDNLFARKSIISPQDILTEFARFVRDSALEEAKAAIPDHLMPDDIVLISEAIDALKEPQP